MSICIVAHMAFGAIRGGATGHAGGVEHQTTTTARWLARRGHRVSLIVWNEGQPDEVEIDGVRVIGLCSRDAGLPGLRFLHPRWTSLNRALRRADADVYYHNCAEYVTGQIALWCRRQGRPFVYSVASDPECDPSLPMLPHARERLLFRAGLRRAHRIIVQTRRQQRMLREGLGLDAIVLPMPCAGPDDAEYRPPLPPDDKKGARVVWVGRISPEKRLGVLLDVAAAVPEVTFDVVGDDGGANGEGERLLARARSLPNVRVLGRVTRDRMPAVYQGAAGLICTSAYEGFPNTFLEAWSHGVPVLSTIDPDNLIGEQGLGIAAADTMELTAGVRRLIASADEWRSMSARARRHYSALHRTDDALARFEQVFVESSRNFR